MSVGDGQFRLDIRTRPIICEYHEWLAEQQDEDAEDFNYDIELPATINGQTVYGVEDEFILADELPEPLNDDEMSEVFDLGSMEKAEEAMEKWKSDGISLEVASKRGKCLKLHEKTALYLQQNTVFVNRSSSQFK